MSPPPMHHQPASSAYTTKSSLHHPFIKRETWYAKIFRHFAVGLGVIFSPSIDDFCLNVRVKFSGTSSRFAIHTRCHTVANFTIVLDNLGCTTGACQIKFPRCRRSSTPNTLTAEALKVPRYFPFLRSGDAN